MVFQHGGDEMILNVGCRQACVRTPKSARFGKAGGHDACALAAMFDNRFDHLCGAGQRIPEKIVL